MVASQMLYADVYKMFTASHRCLDNQSAWRAVQVLKKLTKNDTDGEVADRLDAANLSWNILAA